MRYRPFSSVIADFTFSISTGLAASTVTPGITAPDVSLTVPVNALWARATAGTRTRLASTSKNVLAINFRAIMFPQSANHRARSDQPLRDLAHGRARS